jgi:ribosomal protein S18 acetylase RimI-like enzyme
LRLLRDADREELLSAFSDSFRCAPEYADHPLRSYRERAAKYVDGFYGDVRGSRSPASTVIVRDGQIAAAALFKDREAKPALLDCLLVRPAYFRQGLATAVATRAVYELARTGAAVLRRSAMLANEASIAWHLAFGFREIPDALVAQARFYEASGECDRLDALGKLAPAERERLTALAEYWWKEVIRLNNLPFTKRHPGLDD